MANLSAASESRPYEAADIARADAFIAKARHQLLIGGRWVDAVSGDTFAIVDPATGR